MSRSISRVEAARKGSESNQQHIGEHKQEKGHREAVFLFETTSPSLGGFIGPPDLAAARSSLSRNADVLPGTTGSVEFENYDVRPAVGPWRAARDALEVDADTVLPSQSTA